MAWKGAPWVAGTLVLLLGVLMLALFTANPPLEAATEEFEGSSDAGQGDIATGPKDARVVLIEYADFECAACARFSAALAPLRDKYRDDARFVFRFFPLENHPYALVSAQAAYAAHLQGRFWEMHDLLYETQEEWSKADDPLPHFEGYATQLGLDLERFRDDMASPSTTAFISAQKEDGYAAGVDRTPYFVLDGLALLPRNADNLVALLEERL